MGKSDEIMKRNQIAWWLWAVGTALIVLSWFNAVNQVFGWCGFALALVGSVISWGIRPPSAQPTEAPKDESEERP